MDKNVSHEEIKAKEEVVKTTAKPKSNHSIKPPPVTSEIPVTDPVNTKECDETNK